MAFWRSRQRDPAEQPLSGVQPPDSRVQPEQLGVAGQGAAQILPGPVLPGPGPPLHQLDEVPAVRLDHLVHVGAGHLPGQQVLRWLATQPDPPTAISATDAAASPSPASLVLVSRSPSSTRASRMVNPGYSDVMTAVTASRPSCVARK